MKLITNSEKRRTERIIECVCDHINTIAPLHDINRCTKHTASMLIEEDGQELEFVGCKLIEYGTYHMYAGERKEYEKVETVIGIGTTYVFDITDLMYIEFEDPILKISIPESAYNHCVIANPKEKYITYKGSKALSIIADIKRTATLYDGRHMGGYLRIIV